MLEYQINAHSSALQLVYEMALGLDIKNLQSPHKGDLIAYCIRQSAIADTPKPALMQQCWDVGVVRRYLCDRGPLVEQPTRKLVLSAILIVR